MGMIRVSDDVQEKLSAIADGRSMSATIEMLLSDQGAADFSETQFNSRMDKLGVYLKEEFASLRELLEDTAVDRVERVVRPNYSSHSSTKTIPWDETMRELTIEFSDNLTEGGKWQEEYGNMQDEFIYTCVGNTIYFQPPEDINKYPYMEVTPEIRKYVEEHELPFMV